jgi:hypothetical protein
VNSELRRETLPAELRDEIRGDRQENAVVNEITPNIRALSDPSPHVDMRAAGLGRSLRNLGVNCNVSSRSGCYTRGVRWLVVTVVLALGGAVGAQPNPSPTQPDAPPPPAAPVDAASPVPPAPPAQPVSPAMETLPTSSSIDLRPPGQTPPICCRKRPWIAFALSLVPTLGGLALLPGSQDQGSTRQWKYAGAGGVLLIGPSLGHVYAWQDPRTKALALRLLGFALIGGCDWIASDTNFSTVGLLPFVGIVGLCSAGISGMAIGVVVDVARAPGAAREYNRAHGLDAAVTVVPLQTPSGLAPGVGLVGRF